MTQRKVAAVGAFEIGDLLMEHVDEWAALLQRVYVDDPRVVAWTPEVLRTRFTDDFGVAGPHSLAGAWFDGSLVGYARVFQYGGTESRILHLAGTVDPAVRRHGIGIQLLRWTLSTAQKWTRVLGPVVVVVDAAASADPDLRAILAQLAFRENSTFVEMSYAISADNLPRALNSVSVLSYSSEHEAGVAEVNRDACRDDGEFRAVLAKRSFRPDLSRVALDFESGETLGYLLVQHSPGDVQGWIDVIAVRPSERGRDVTNHLIVSALTAMCEEGLTSAGLGVIVNSTIEQDLAVCAGLGFTEDLRWTRFVRSVDQGTSRERPSQL